MEPTSHTNTIIIGAGAAGLACAASLKRKGISCVVLEKDARIGDVWRNRYSRLHLHTTKSNSCLPYYKMPEHYPKYVSKDEFARYLEAYADASAIRPRLNEKVVHVAKNAHQWHVYTERELLASTHLIIATGLAAKPRPYHCSGIENFQGKILDSSQYSSGKEFRNKKVLVVGFGNSACEIALCLYENGARPAMSVRNCVNILPRDILGISVVNIAVMENWLTKISPRIPDAINRPILALINRRIDNFGLNECKHGPLTQITLNKKIPLLDIGTMRLIRERKIDIFPAIREVGRNQVKFTDGRKEFFDVIISAIGYHPSLSDFLDNPQELCDPSGMPRTSGRQTIHHGLFFCGFDVASTGMLRQIAMEARKIASIIVRESAKHSSNYQSSHA
jgi:cation diffusion facilitator CzcD-associated flavoprotein CzcO